MMSEIPAERLIERMKLRVKLINNEIRNGPALTFSKGLALVKSRADYTLAIQLIENEVRSIKSERKKQPS